VSAPSGQLGGNFGRGLPGWTRPREEELPGAGRTRLIETTLLVLVGLVLAIATVNDVVRQVHVNHRLVADLRTWRQYTGHAYKNLSVEQDFYGHTTRDIVCGNVAPGAPKERTQLCLVLTGPVVAGRRAARGGFYLPAKVDDVRSYRYACYGSARSAGLCPR
jgi:hypothetical protein